MTRLLAAAICAALIFSGTARAQDHQHHPAEQVGAVSFPTTCNPAVQPRIDRAVAMLHSFWFPAAHQEFQAVAAADGNCAIAWWGISMTSWGNPFVRQPIPAELQTRGLDAAERAASLASTASHREQMYVDAALALWRDAANADHLERAARHEAAMKKLYEAHPEDPETAVFYARSLIANASPADLEFKSQLYAATLLEPLSVSQPDHPGVVHYIIHTFDAPSLAAHGLNAAKRYAQLAPAAPHALHMPSHIFTRLGYWDESIETNRRSAAAEPDSNAAVHPNDYMVYAYLQQGRDAEAFKVVERTKLSADRYYGAILGYNAVAMQSRHPLERSAWSEAAVVPIPVNAPAYITAVARFARAIGAARSGNIQLAGEESEALALLRDNIKEQGDSYWATIVGAQHLAASAWTAHAKGANDEALRLADEAADLEETVEKHPVTPGPLLPARELQADLFLELGRAADALAAYEKTLEREPRRARALFGAAKAAEKAGEMAKAREYYTQLADLMKDADPTREEARIASAFLSRS